MTSGASVPDLSVPALGVDGGGSTCRMALIWDGLRHEVTLGPCNVFSDPDGALATLRAGIADLAKQAGLPPDEPLPCPAHLGLAGVTGTSALDLPLTKAQITDDQHIALHGAHWGRAGTLIGVGTGSFVARLSGGTARFAGGWGDLLGDEASAAWIVHQAVRAALHAIDGTGPGSDLTAMMQARIGPRAALIGCAAWPKADRAALAPQITALDDPLVAHILDQGAAYLADSAQALGWREGEALCLTGSLAPLYTPRLPAPMASAVTPPRLSALDAALCLAQGAA